MLTNIKKWYRPHTIDEALSLMKKGEVIPYLGGTGFLHGKTVKASAFIDMRGLKLNFVEQTDSGVYIGAGRKFSDIGKCQCTDGRVILRDAIKQAASTPLRNLITIGGSLAMMPAWSNIVTPLLALDAKVEILGTVAGTYEIEDYIRQKPLDGTSLIHRVFIPLVPGNGVYYRFGKTRFDYSDLDIGVYLEIKDDLIGKARIVIGNIFPKAKRLHNVEDYLVGKTTGEIQLVEYFQKHNIFPTKTSSKLSEYWKNIIHVHINRAIKEIEEKFQQEKNQ